MLKFFNVKNQNRIIWIMAFVILVAALISIAGKTELVTNEDGSQSIKRTLWGKTIGK